MNHGKNRGMVTFITIFMVCLFWLLLMNLKDSLFFRKTGEVNTATITTDRESVTPKDSSEPYVSPIDFETLREENGDIYAWLDIPGTKISYPILQHSSDDSFYLRRGIDGKFNVNGSLFTESQYNKADFSDPVTIIYGHNMLNGNMFGRLQSYYSDKEFFSKNNKVIVYLPDREMHFTIFAAVPFDNWHILYNCNFSDTRAFNVFFNGILSIRAIGANFNENTSVEPDHQVLILSTCLKGNSNKRFLVCAKLYDGK